MIGRRTAFAALAVAVWTTHAFAESRPVLIGDSESETCQIALSMATKAYLSTEPALDWPVPQPDETRASIVLSRLYDSSSGAFLDPAAFEKIVRGEGYFARAVLYWQRHPTGGQRLAVFERPHSWRGHWYTVFVIKKDLSPGDFLERAGYVSDRQSPATLSPVLGDNRWTPPIILEHPMDKSPWVIDTGQFGNALGGPWRILVLDGEDMVSPCQIAFSDGDDVGLARLPAVVREFAAIADEALGPGHNEGTLQPTARIRVGVSKDWALVAHRPWALTQRPYNTRDEVDRGLSAWAQNLPARQRLLAKLQAVYAPSEQALAAYYEERFGLSGSEARSFSVFALDHMLRRYFVFHSKRGGRRDPVATPWPANHR